MANAAAFLFLGCLAASLAHAATSKADAAAALERAVTFFSSNVAVRGTYLWQYSDDLQKREGEGKAGPTQGWIQPPGTPAVGLAFLAAWHATSNAFFLDAARETARGLLLAQVRSGGWHYSVDFDPASRKKVQYRFNGAKDGGRNVTTFDDDTTQAALRFLARFDEATGFKEAPVREAIDYALAALKKSQYPNGAWPQGYDEFPDPAKFPPARAAFPADWPRTWPGSQRYWLNYTLNDNSMATLIRSLFEIASIYDAPAAGSGLNQIARECRRAAMHAADFLILAQLPEPQPAWAQQYSSEMFPVWARKFEPPALSGGESQSVLQLLLDIYVWTGDRKYLEPIPRALAYLRRSRLKDGRLARFYELRTNKPLYFTRDYQLTYSDADMPTHYAFKVADRSDAIAREFERVKALPPSALGKFIAPPTRTRPGLAHEVAAVIASQDKRGAWVEQGTLKHYGGADASARIIRSSTFISNVELLSNFLQAP